MPHENKKYSECNHTQSIIQSSVILAHLSNNTVYGYSLFWPGQTLVGARGNSLCLLFWIAEFHDNVNCH